MVTVVPSSGQTITAEAAVWHRKRYMLRQDVEEVISKDPEIGQILLIWHNTTILLLWWTLKEACEEGVFSVLLRGLCDLSGPVVNTLPKGDS